jgi:glycosyl transferase, family 25
VGAKGCFYSHLAVLEEAESSGLESVLIFEDDCDFVRDIEFALPRAVNALRANEWDFFFGGHDKLVCDERRPEPVQQIISGSWIQGAHFVAFRKKAIGALIPYLRQEIEHLARDPIGASRGIDAAYCHFGREFPEFRYFVAWPKLGYQRPSRSDIAERSALDLLPVFGPIVVPARKLKRYFKRRST